MNKKITSLLMALSIMASAAPVMAENETDFTADSVAAEEISQSVIEEEIEEPAEFDLPEFENEIEEPPEFDLPEFEDEMKDTAESEDSEDMVHLDSDDVTLFSYGTKYDDYLYYDINNDGTAVTITGCDYSDGELVIPSEIEGLPVMSIGEGAFRYCRNLTSVTIPNNVTYIGDYAFSYCDNLTSITIPDSVTSIGELAFFDCCGLTSVTIPDNVTYIGYGAFSGCDNLTDVYITNIDSWCRIEFGDYSSTPMRYATNLYINGELAENLDITIPNDINKLYDYTFRNWNCIRSVTIPNSVTYIGNSAFYDCTGLTEITIPDSVTYIGDYAFDGCENLTDVYITDIGSWLRIEFGDYSSTPMRYATNLYINGELAENLDITIPNDINKIYDYAFFDWNCIRNITIPDSVTYIGYAAFSGTAYFNDESNWQDYALYIGNHLISAPEVDSYTIRDNTICIGGGAFAGLESLTSVTIPDSVISIGNFAFNECTGLTSITIPDSVTYIGDRAFYDCTGLTEITIPDSVTYIGDRAFDGCTGLTEIIIPDSVTYIGDYAFCSCNNLTEITIPDSVTYIGDCVFSCCERLTTVNFNAINCKLGDSTFGECTSLTTVNIGENVRIIPDEAFIYCERLTSVTIPSSVTKIGNRAFYSCESLTDVYITDIDSWLRIEFGDYDSTPMGYTTNLYINGELAENLDITIPNDINKINDYTFLNWNCIRSVTIPNSVTYIGDRAFDGCTGLTEITIPDSVTYIGDYAFYYCNNLTEITIPDSVTYIGDCVFYHCESLTTVNFNVINCKLGDSTFGECTSLTTVNIGENVRIIPDEAFIYCERLTSVTIPSSVTKIGNSAFDYCENLTDVYITDIDSWLRIEFGDYSSTPMGYATNLYINGELAENLDITIPNDINKINNYTFLNWNCIRSVTIPNSVTYIGNRAFNGCESLTRITIPDSVTRIDYSAFNSCGALTDVYYLGSEDQWNSISIEYYNDPLTEATIHFNAITNPTEPETAAVTVSSPVIGEDGTSVVEVTVPALSNVYANGIVYGVSYSDSGVTDVSSTPLVNGGDTSLEVGADSAQTVRVFVWNDKMQPITTAFEAQLQPEI